MVVAVIAAVAGAAVAASVLACVLKATGFAGAGLECVGVDL